jgi:periplasmic protein TonB
VKKNLILRPENEAPDIIPGLCPWVFDDKFKPPAELDIPIEGSREEAAEPFDLLLDEARADEDFSAPAAGRGSIFIKPALLLTSAGLHIAAVLFLFFFAAVLDIALYGDPGDPDLEVSWVTLHGGGAEPEEYFEELEFEPLESLNEPEPFIVEEEEKPPPPPEKPKKPPVKKVEAPAGPGSTDGEAAEGGGGSGVSGGGEALWKALKVPTPAYPEASIAAQEQGLCVVRVTVLPSGEIGGVSLIQSSSYSRLDFSALAAARRIKFKLSRPPAPAHSVTVKVPYRFSLKNV